MLKKLAAGALVVLVLFAFSLFSQGSSTTVSAAAGINHQINFQGKLVNPSGTNVTDGSYSIVFSLYSVSSAGSAIWTETQSPTITNGIFQVNLGSVTALPGSVDFNTDNLYLGIKVGADAEMTPRIQFTSVPQAFNSEKLGGIDKTGFIQNQTASPQSAGFNINGTGTANILQAANLDTASAGSLGVGTTNATSISLNQNTNLAANKNLVFAGGSGGFDQSASTGAFATGSGNVSLNGNTTVASGKTLTVAGTGATTLGGTLAVGTASAGTAMVNIVSSATAARTLLIRGGTGNPVTQTFSYSGAQQSFVVPAGVNSLTITGYGAEGGSTNATAGTGKGAAVTETISVTPGETLYFNVGGAGPIGAYNAGGPTPSVAGGFNGGGTGGGGGTGAVGGAGGGGATDVRRGGSALANRVIVAGGGGGSGGGTIGGGGGNAGNPNGVNGGIGDAATAATGGTQAAGGTGGTADISNGTNGSLGNGGNGGSGGSGGGGGAGGGYYGGGGGGGRSDFAGGGGAGGSSYTDPAATGVSITAGVQTGNGALSFTYTPPTNILTEWQKSDGSTAAIIDGNGNVGIGTGNPASLLSVGSASQFKVSGTGAVSATSDQISGTVDIQGNNAVANLPYSLVNDETTTNVITNPSFETGTTGWSPAASATISQDTTAKYIGNYGGRVTIPNIAGYPGVQSNSTPATAGQIWTGSVWVNLTSTSPDLAILVRALDGSSAILGDARKQIGGTTGWQRVSVTYTMPASTAYVTMIITQTTNVGQSAFNFAMDGAQLEQKTGPTTYADGSMGTGYTWTGTANASTSTRTAGLKYISALTSGSVNPFTVTTSGNIGIGTATPHSQLEVSSSTGTSYITINSATSQAALNLSVGSLTKWQVGTQSNGQFFIYDIAHSRDVFNGYINGDLGIAAGGGNVGIGTSGPSYKLDVTGDINSSTALRVGGVVVCTSAGCGGAGSGTTTVGGIDTQAKSANGAVISGINLYLQSADATYPGLVGTGTQTFAGVKTFNTTSNTVFGNGSTGGIQIGDGIITKASGSAFQLNSGIDFATGTNLRVNANGTANAAGNALTLAAGNANGSTTGNVGGALTLTAGSAAGTGNNNGGNVTLDGGMATGTGAKGYVVLQGAGGNVGIGTAIPTSTLQVAGTFAVSGHSALGTGATIDQNIINSSNGVTTAGIVLNVRETSTDVVKQTLRGGVFDMTYDPSGATTTQIVGVSGYARSATGNAQAINQLTAVQGYAIHNGTNTAVAYGFAAGAINNGTGTISQAYGVNSTVRNGSTGTITNGIGSYAQVVNSGSGTFTTGYGFYGDVPSGTIGTYYAAAFMGGNVGIGTTTPSTTLQVRKDVASGLGAVVTISNYGGSGQTGINFNTYDPVGNPASAQILAVDDGSFGNSITFSTKNSGANTNALTEKMRITNSGNVGIGTSGGTVGYQLQVKGSGQTTSGLNDVGSTGAMLLLQDTASAGGSGGALLFGASTGRFASIKGLLTDNSNQSRGDIAFSTRNATTDTTLTERMIIKDNGNIGIGTSSAGGRLSVRTSNSLDGVTLDGNSQGLSLLVNTGSGSYNGMVQANDTALIFRGTGADAQTGFVIAPWASSTSGIRIQANGNVCIGVTSCSNKIGVSGNIGASGSITSFTTPDLAETIAAAPGVEAADVVMADPNKKEAVVKTTGAYSGAAVGVISDGTSAFMIHAHGTMDDPNVDAGKKPLVLAGRVPVKISNEGGAVAPGDYLTSSSTPGYAMKATHAGPTIGKALGFFDGTSEKGTVLALINVSYYSPTSGNDIQANSAALNSLTISGGANMNNLNVGGLAKVDSLQVMGSADIAANLHIGGDLTVVGSASIGGNLDVGGNLTVKGLTTVVDITVGGHVISAGAVPTGQALGDATATASVNLDGNDTAGTITITTGATPTIGDIASITFTKAFGKTPHIILTPHDGRSAPVVVYPDSQSASGFHLGLTNLPAANTSYSFEYFVIQ